MSSMLNCGGNPSISNTLLLQAKPLAQNVIARRVIGRMLVIGKPGRSTPQAPGATGQRRAAHRHTRLGQPVAALVALPEALGLARGDGAVIGVEGIRIDRRRQTKRPPAIRSYFCARSLRSFLLSSMRTISARICSMRLPSLAEMAAVSSSRVRACVRRSCANCVSVAPARSSSRVQSAIRLSSSSPLRWANQGRSTSRQRRSASTCYTSAACWLQSAVSGCRRSIWARALSTASCTRLRSSICVISASMRGCTGNGSSMCWRTNSVRLPIDFIDTV